MSAIFLQSSHTQLEKTIRGKREREAQTTTNDLEGDTWSLLDSYWFKCDLQEEDLLHSTPSGQNTSQHTKTLHRALRRQGAVPSPGRGRDRGEEEEGGEAQRREEILSWFS